MTDLGAPDRPLRFVGEELQLDVFSGTDPADTGAHRWWYRDDLSVNESDAVIRVNNNGTIVDVPVFEESNTVEDGIETTFGVVAPGLAEPAFVPLAVPEDAAFDFARVETPAGQELAMHDRLAPGSARPDSEANQKLAHRWLLDDVNGTVEDTVGNADGTNNGITPISGDWVGGSGGEGDGSSHIAIGSLDSGFVTNIGNSFGVAFSIETTITDPQSIFGVQDDGDGRRFYFELVDGRPRIQAITGGIASNNLTLVSADVSVADGEPHRVVWSCDGQNGSNWDCYIDQSNVSTTIESNNLPSSLSGLSIGSYMFARNNNGTVVTQLTGVLDDTCLYHESLSTQESISYDNPWS